MKYLKKAVSILLSAMMIFSFAATPMCAWAASDYVKYTTYEDFAVVTSYSSMAQGAIEIEATYNGLPVVEIATEAFKDSHSITSVTIPASVTKIGSGAFAYCVALEKVVFEGTDCNIGSYAFRSCSQLSDVTLPSQLKAISNQMFYDCKSLVKLDIPETVTSIGTSAFATCTALSDFTIPAAVTSIGTNAFIRCNAVQSYEVASGNTAYKSIDGVLYDISGETLIQYPCGNTEKNISVVKSTKKVADSAFAGNKYIESVSFPAGLEIIDSYAFQYCENLKGVTLSSGITTLGADAFGRCTSLKSIVIPASLTSYEYAFYMSGLEEIVIENGATEISRNAFEKCKSLTSVSLPSTLKTIGTAAFIDCTALESFEIPESVETIGVKAFGNCDNIKLKVYRNSAGHEYAEDNGISYEFAEKVIGIEITKLPAKLKYNYKDTVDTSGMVVVAKYANSEPKEITDYEISPESFTKTGTRTVTVSYEGYSDSFGVSVSYSFVQIIILVFLLGFLWY